MNDSTFTTHFTLQSMKTIKIFLASSEELEFDRMAFGNLVRRLNDIYEKRGISIKLFEWEDYDAAYNNRRKQDEYDDKVRESDMFLALFHKTAGKFTVEEFDVATEEFKKHASPKVYAYCKDLSAGEEESPELKAFKKQLFEELGHYWCRYNNKDSMQLHFVMQLQLVENSRKEDLKVENGAVTLEGQTIAKMENLQFAAANEDYQKMSQELAALPEKIEKARLRLDKFPDDEDLIDDLQQKLNRYYQLKEEFEQYQQLLFNTAKRITQLQGERITERMRRAMDAFNEGRAHEANIILNEAEADARRALEDFKKSKEITEQKRQNVFISIEELQLKASSLMADVSIPIEDRISLAENVYAQADEMATECDYDKEKYIKLLFEYEEFLNKYAHYNKALEIAKKLVQLCEQTYGKKHSDTARSYFESGVIFSQLGNDSIALDYLQKALAIRENVHGMEHPDTARSYNSLGIIYDNQGDYAKSFEYHKKALTIREKLLGKEHPDTATSYSNIGCVYGNLGQYDKALEYYQKALNIQEKIFGQEHPDTAGSYNSIGLVYDKLGDYTKALEYYQKALNIQERVLGQEHPDTAISYINIGNVYGNLGEYAKALEYFQKALNIREKVLGQEHPDTAQSYNNIGTIYYHQGDYDKALEYHFKSLATREKVLGKEHPDTAQSYNNIGLVYANKGDYDKAMEYYFKDLAISEKVLGREHPDTATSYNNIGYVYQNLGDYDKALEYFFKALAVYEQVLGKEHPDTAQSYNNIGIVYYKLGDYDKALEYFLKALNVQEKVLGKNHIYTAMSHFNVGSAYKNLGNYSEALKHFELCLQIEKNQGASAEDIQYTENSIKELKQIMASNDNNQGDPS